jgi:hypothetical protein
MNNELSGVTAGFDLLPTDPTSIEKVTAHLGTESGSANAYVVTRTNPVTAYEDGLRVGFFATHANTAGCTLNVDGVGVVSFVAPDGVAFTADDITVGVFYEAVFDNSNNRWQMLNPTTSWLVQGDLRVTWAEEWANKAEDSLVSAAAGGDEVDDYSALHFSIKSSDSAAAALVSENAAAASYDSFDDRYLGAKASDPTLDNDGAALLTGAMYWNTTNDVMKVYNGAAWEDVGSSAANITEYTSTASQTVYTGADDHGVVLSYQAGFLMVYLNGILLENTTDYTATDGSTITLIVAANSGDILQSFGFGTFDVADGKSTQIVKTSDETRNSTSTYAVDGELILNGLAASSEYIVEGQLIVTTSATPDIKFRLGGNGTFVAAGGTYNASLWCAGDDIDVLSNNLAFDILSGKRVTTDGTDSLFIINFRGTVETNTATSIQLEWAQNTSDAADCIVHLDSHIRALKV